MKRRTRLALVAAFMAFALVACGSGTAEISPSAAVQLDAEVGQIRAAIDAGDVTRARELLIDLRTTVVGLTTAGGITGDRALEINQAIAALDEQLIQNPPTTQPPSTTRPATTTTTTRPATTTSTTTTEKPDDKPGKGRNEDDD